MQSNNSPEISVICLCYNNGRFVIDTLESIKRQTFSNFELIICDDRSKDNSVPLIESWLEINQADFVSVKFLKNPVNMGIAKTLNRALELTHGKYFSIIGDDEWYPAYLQSLYEIIVNSEDSVALVFSDTYVINYETKEILPDINPLRHISQSYSEPNQLVSPLEKDIYRFNAGYLYECFFKFSPVIAFTTLIKTNIVKKLGGYDEKYSFEDLPMWLKMFKQYSCIFLDKKLATYNRHPQSITSVASFNYHRSILDVFAEQIRAKKTSKNDMFVKRKIFQEYKTVAKVWVQSPGKKKKDLLDVFLMVSALYPLSIPKAFKTLLRTIVKY